MGITYHQKQRYALLPSFLLCAFCLCNDITHAESTIVLDIAQQSYSVGQYIEVLRDPNASITIQELTRPDADYPFEISPQKEINLGRTVSNYWFRFRLTNPLDSPQQLLLEITNPNLINISLYQKVSSLSGETQWQVKTDGVGTPISKRDINYRYLVFKVLVPPQGTHDYYLHMPPQLITTLPITLWHTEDFAEHNFDRYYFYGVYYGA
ncbi:MAG: 7TM-DISM domain-containing protein, partial [Pseudomonadota bacterium]